MISNKINVKYRNLIVVGESDYSEFLSYDKDKSDQQKIEQNAFLICQDITIPTKFKYLVLKPQSLWLKKESSFIKDIYGNTGDNIQSYPPYLDGEEIKVGFLSDDFSYYSVMKDLFGNAFYANELKIKGISFSKIYLYDLNEKNRIRAASTTSTNNGSFISRWI